MRKQIATIAVVVLLVFAGCNTGGSGDTTTTAPGTTAAPPNDTTTVDEADPMYDSPLDAEAVAQNHEVAIRNTSTFTLVSTSNQSQGNQSITVVSSIAVNQETGEVFLQQNTSTGVVETYTTGNGTTYQRQELAENETRYAVLQEMPTAAQLAGGDVQPFVNAFEFDYTGTNSVDGTSTDVYAASGVKDLNASAPGFGNVDAANVSSVDARVYVTNDGLVKQFDYSLTTSTGPGGGVTINVQQRYTEMGSTTVEAPAWLDDARNNTTA